MMKRETFLPSLSVTNICLSQHNAVVFTDTSHDQSHQQCWLLGGGVDHVGRVWKDDGVWYNYDGLIQIALGNSQFPAIIADLSRIDTV